MVTRYLILVGRVADEDRQKVVLGSASAMHVAIERPGFRALVNDEMASLILPRGTGCIIGKLFAKFGPARSISPEDQEEGDRIASQSVAGLINRYWGEYVACFLQPRGVTILRDPGAACPCYYLRLVDGYAIASDISLLVEFKFLRPHVAWDQIPRYLSAKDLPFEHTGLQGVRELLAGTTLTVSNDRAEIALAWSPWDHVERDAPPESEDLPARLWRTVHQCVRSAVSDIDSGLLMLSGGLDSSVVASCLAGAATQISAMTMVSSDAYGDERQYAQEMASHQGLHLHEHHYSLDDIDLSKSVAARLPKPVAAIHELALYSAVVRRCREIGASAVITGNGGDNVFYNSSSVRPFFDRLKDDGFSVGAFHTFNDICSITRVSSGKALKAIASFALRPRHEYVWERETSFLDAALTASLRKTTYDHAWLSSPPGAAVGKLGHIAFLLRMQNHIEGYLRSDDLPVINPLTSQPVLELALAIPTWRQFEGGINRSVVRRAFQQHLPPLILDRRQKGSPGGFALSIIEAKATEIRERLLDGELVRRRFLDGGAIDHALRQGPAIGLGYMRLLSFLDIEAWIRNWEEGQTNAP
ncbi:asparagine synthetase B family protein [Sphingobium terrigena]|jgi:asparagine synthase (glutamine-hydrolysing)|uniref:asparagine synthase (glutamine-hydrolyzing) n=1 Tax=Sphingobium terrigena TaxID=2304063 RepID=A0A418YPD2_9SPHN|nr:asparagine synthetase B family protein [Sphingobium terrigena]